LALGLGCAGGSGQVEPDGHLTITEQAAQELAAVPVQVQMQPPPAPAQGPLPAEHAAEARARWVSNPSRWQAAEPEFFRPVFEQPDARERSLAARAETRSFDGAPPRMTHSEDFGGSYACLDCHESGRVIGSRVARPMSHQPMLSCTQCHVASPPEALEGLESPLTAISAFVGMLPPTLASPASEGAPLSIPHTTHMRVRCLSCHGEFGYEGIRIDHTARAQCTQCHVPRLALDLQAVARGG